MYKTDGDFYITNDDPGYAVILATYPASYVTFWSCILDQANIQLQRIVKRN